MSEPDSSHLDPLAARALEGIRRVFGDHAAPTAPSELRAYAGAIRLHAEQDDRLTQRRWPGSVSRGTRLAVGVFVVALAVGLTAFVTSQYHSPIAAVSPSPQTVASGHFDEDGLVFDYPQDWRLAPQYPSTSTTYRPVATFLVGSAGVQCTALVCMPELGTHSAFVQVGWYKTVEPFGPWPPSDAIQVLTIGGQPAALSVATTGPGSDVGLIWSVRMVEGQESFFLSASLRGLDQAAFRRQIEQLLTTVRAPTSR